MNALYIADGRLSYRTDLPDLSPGRGQVAIEVLLAGICGTDLELLRGYAGFTGVPGHEFVGRVIEAPDSPEWSGRRVVADINLSCGICPSCRRGHAKHCSKRRVVGLRGCPGALSTRIVLPVSSLRDVPDEMADEEAVFAEPLAAALEVGRRLDGGSEVLLVGSGRLGQLILRTLTAQGHVVNAVCRHGSQREAVERGGGVVVEEAEVLPDSFETVVEASGSPDGLVLALRAAAPLGTIILKSTFCGHARLDASALVVKELHLRGSRCGDILEALEVLKERRLDVESLIDSTFPLEEGEKAFDRASEPGVFKVLLTPGKRGR